MKTKNIIADAKNRHLLASGGIKSWRHTAKLTIEENLFETETQLALFHQLYGIVERSFHHDMQKLAASVDKFTVQLVVKYSHITLAHCEKEWMRYLDLISSHCDEIMSQYSFREVMYQTLVEHDEETASNFFKVMKWDNFEEIRESLSKSSPYIEFEQ